MSEKLAKKGMLYTKIRNEETGLLDDSAPVYPYTTLDSVFDNPGTDSEKNLFSILNDEVVMTRRQLLSTDDINTVLQPGVYSIGSTVPKNLNGQWPNSTLVVFAPPSGGNIVQFIFKLTEGSQPTGGVYEYASIREYKNNTWSKWRLLGNLLYLGTNPSGDDTRDKWKNLGSGYALITEKNVVPNQPNQYGIIINYTASAEVAQIWHGLKDNVLFTRACNSSGWSPWTPVGGAVKLWENTGAKSDHFANKTISFDLTTHPWKNLDYYNFIVIVFRLNANVTQDNQYNYCSFIADSNIRNYNQLFASMHVSDSRTFKPCFRQISILNNRQIYFTTGYRYDFNASTGYSSVDDNAFMVPYKIFAFGKLGNYIGN